ncbi:hypothetical protein WMY93_005859 [Mugilogobius chulae]|uniref:Uncharacterized protein n=1 Tax=Mugilogobius chulae TaxID=88201 RepID=A0AAW0PS22_9GOBI
MASVEPGDGGGKDEKAGAMALNPGVPIRGIRMKFAVLAGLVEVKEVSNRDIVETVFNLFGSEFVQDRRMNESRKRRLREAGVRCKVRWGKEEE